MPQAICELAPIAIHRDMIINRHVPPFDNPDLNRAEARRIMNKVGHGPDNRLKVRLTVRDLPCVRDPAVILVDQLKEVYIDGDLETIIDTTNYLLKVLRSDYAVALSPPAAGLTPTGHCTSTTGAAAS
ncbi:MAG TPA: hypothetical protein VJX94_26640 [Stellaceae bacterium]|nr:hypothetical protein [Stellaceae bacterium]